MSPRELAAAIRRGAGLVEETLNHCGCALGTAYIAVTGKNLLWDTTELDGSWTFRAAEGLGLTREFATQISNKHFNGTTRLEIADWLDTLEPEAHPADKQAFDSFMQSVLQPVETSA